MGLKLKVWNIGTEGMEYVSVFILKIPSGMYVIVKEVLVYTYFTAVLYVLYRLLFLGGGVMLNVLRCQLTY